MDTSVHKRDTIVSIRGDSVHSDLTETPFY